MGWLEAVEEAIKRMVELAEREIFNVRRRNDFI